MDRYIFLSILNLSLGGAYALISLIQQTYAHVTVLEAVQQIQKVVFLACLLNLLVFVRDEILVGQLLSVLRAAKFH